jgi:hypothetical protein
MKVMSKALIINLIALSLLFVQIKAGNNYVYDINKSQPVFDPDRNKITHPINPLSLGVWSCPIGTGYLQSYVGANNTTQYLCSQVALATNPNFNINKLP